MRFVCGGRILFQHSIKKKRLWLEQNKRGGGEEACLGKGGEVQKALCGKGESLFRQEIF